MAVFPNYTQAINDDESSRSIIKRMEDDWETHSRQNLYFQSQADIDLRFYCGDQTVWNDLYGGSIPYNRQQFSFNLIKRIVEMPAGYQRQNRKSTVAVPIEGGDQLTSDQFTKLIMWNDQQEGVLETISDAFTGSLITGMNMLQVWVDYGDDPISGDIKVDNCAYNSFVIDPFFKRQDLSDCNFVWKRSFVTPSQARVLLPGYGDRLDEISVSSTTDGKFQYMPESLFYDSKTLLTYDEYFYRTFRDSTKLIDNQLGGSIEWTGTDEQLREYTQAFPNIEVVKDKVPTVKQAIVVQGRVMYHGGNTLGIDSYPFVPVLGYYTPELTTLENRIQGMVRGLRDSQFLFNRRKIIELDILESQVNSGWIAEEDSVTNPKSLHKTGQGQVIWRKKGSTPDQLQRIDASSVPQGMFEVSNQMASLMQQISGVNEEMLGSATDDKAGILSMLRQGAGLLTLRRLFDQLDLSQKLLGRLRLSIMQKNFTPGKVKRVINEEPSQQFYDRDFGKYDAAIEEGFNTTTQRQLEHAQLLNMKSAGINIPSEYLIQTATIQNKDKLIAAIQQAEQQAAQAQQAQSQMAMQEQEATIKLAQAESNYKNAGASERYSREENLAVERTAEAEKDHEQAILNKMKALKELQDIDLTQIERLLTIARSLEVNVKNVVEQEPAPVEQQL